MKKLNKSLLAAATASVLALSGVASAATLSYNPGGAVPHHTFGRDIIAGDSTIIRLPNVLAIQATSADSVNVLASNPLTGIAIGDTIRVRITLTGAEFSGAYATAKDLAQSFRRGNQLGTGAIITFGETFSGGRQELVFSFNTPAGGVLPGGVTDTFLEFPNGVVSPNFYFTELTKLDAAMGVSEGSVSATVEVTNQTKARTVFSTTAQIARSLDAEYVRTNPLPAPLNLKKIDVASQPNNLTRYAPTGLVGESNTSPPGYTYYQAGGFTLDIETSLPSGTNVYSATAPTPYNLPVQTTLTVSVAGSNLAPWAAITGGMWLSNNVNCGGSTKPLTVNAVTNVATSLPIASSDPFFSTITVPNTPPAQTPTVYVCLGSNGTTQLVPTTLSGEVDIKHNLPAQFRTDMIKLPFNLRDLDMNGTVVTFQNVNPAGNPNAQSFLRLSNHNTFDCPAFIQAKDDNGRLSKEIPVKLLKHQSEQFQIDALEAGVDNKTGPGTPRFNVGLGTPQGKWYVRVLFHCDNVTGSAWNRNKHSDGVTNLTAEKNFGVQWSADTDAANLIP